MSSLGYQIVVSFIDELSRILFVKVAEVYEVPYGEDGKAIPAYNLAEKI